MSRRSLVLVLACVAVVSLVPLGCAPREPAGEPALPAELAPEVKCPTDGSVLLAVPGGEFTMGSPEAPKRVVLKSFYIDRLEVTNAQYGKFLAAVAKQGGGAWQHPQQPKSKKGHVPAFWSNANLGQAKADHPVVGADWFDAYAYAKWTGKRLPTEAEWERAARGTDGRDYPWGSDPPEQGLRYRSNFFGSYLGADGHRFTAPVGTFPAGGSPVGCLNMAGNVSEWCADWYGPLPQERRLTDPTGPAVGKSRVTKGGAWNLGADSIRCFSRWPMDPSGRLASVGFRCAMDVPAAAPAAAAASE